MTRGGVADFETHLDYITRKTAVEENDTALLIDMLDMDEDRRLQNHRAIISNIPGGRDRERSLFEAAERCERQAKGGTLQVSTQYADDWMLLAMRQDAPGWVRKAAISLQQRRSEQQSKAKAAGKALVDVTIGIGKVNLEQAYDRLIWCDDQAVLPEAARPNWKAGPCGRIQTRFVGEFPRGLKPAERRLVLERFCGELAAEGWMYVALAATRKRCRDAAMSGRAGEHRRADGALTLRDRAACRHCQSGSPGRGPRMAERDQRYRGTD